MAGAKETPRQKMIGMMYLVLTALLALNVSNSVLDKFVLINTSLEAGNQEKSSLNAATVERVAKAVSDAGNRPGDRKVLKKARAIRAQTKESFKELKVFKDYFVKMTGGKNENGNYIGQKDINFVSEYMVGTDGGTPKGTEFQKSLNGYSSYLRVNLEEVLNINADIENRAINKKNVALKYPNLGKAAKDIEGFKDDEDQKFKNFLELQFGFNTPMVGALASVSQMQAEILDQESQALNEIANKVGAGDIKFDRIVAMVRPESNTVAAGATYRAEMFIAASSSGITPTMSVDGRPISVVDGKGTVEFKATTQSFNDQGIAEKSYEAAITVKLPGGKDTTFRNPQRYFVAKPVIQVQSGAVQALYLKCGNELTVTVPSLGNSYNPTFRASGAQVIKGTEIGKVTLVPTAKKVVLTVINEGNTIGSRNFSVRRIPKADIQVRAGGRSVGAKPIRMPRSIAIRAVPDESFKTFLPKDARFRVTRAQITLVRSSRAVQSIRATSGDVNLSQFASQARSGDLIVVEVKKVQRKNFRNRVESFSNYSPSDVKVSIK